MDIIYFREDRDRWYISYLLNGKRIRKAVGKDKNTAELVFKDIEVKIAKNNIGFEAFNGLDKWIELFFKTYLEYAKTNLRLETYIKYTAVINIIRAFLAKRSINKPSQLSLTLLEDFKRERKDKV